MRYIDAVAGRVFSLILNWIFHLLEIWLVVIFNLVLVWNQLHQVFSRCWCYVFDLVFIWFCVFLYIFEDGQSLLRAVVIWSQFGFCWLIFIQMGALSYISLIMALQTICYHKFLRKLPLMIWLQKLYLFRVNRVAYQRSFFDKFSVWAILLIVISILDAEFTQLNITIFRWKMIDNSLVQTFERYLLVSVCVALTHFLWFVTCLCQIFQQSNILGAEIDRIPIFVTTLLLNYLRWNPIWFRIGHYHRFLIFAVNLFNINLWLIEIHLCSFNLIHVLKLILIFLDEFQELPFDVVVDLWFVADLWIYGVLVQVLVAYCLLGRFQMLQAWFLLTYGKTCLRYVIWSFCASSDDIWKVSSLLFVLDFETLGAHVHEDRRYASAVWCFIFLAFLFHGL